MRSLLHTRKRECAKPSQAMSAAAGGLSFLRVSKALLATLKMRSNDVEDTHLCKNQARQLCKGVLAHRAGLDLNVNKC